MAQAFHSESGVATISLRLATTYGPGRDQGLTSAPTTAIKAAVLGVPFRLPYQGREHFHYVDDVGAGFSLAAIDPFEGCRVFNLRGQTVATELFVEKILGACDAVGINDPDVGIAPEATSMPFVCDLDDTETVAAFPRMPITSLEDGLADSVRRFQAMADKGTLELDGELNR